MAGEQRDPEQRSARTERLGMVHPVTEHAPAEPDDGDENRTPRTLAIAAVVLLLMGAGMALLLHWVYQLLPN